MLQITLARDHLLVGYGFKSQFDATQSAETQDGCGSRPCLFFAPRRDAHCLVTRKVHTALALKEKSGAVIFLSFPVGENVDLGIWKEPLSKTQAHWVELKQSLGELKSSADIFTQSFSGYKNVAIKIESFVQSDALQERWAIEGLEAGGEAYLVHWHEPEIQASSLLHSTYLHLNNSMLASYRNGVFFGVSARQNKTQCAVAFAECGEIQRQRSSLARLDDFVNLLSSNQTQNFPRCHVAHGHTDGFIAWKIDPTLPCDLSYAYAATKDALETTNFNFELARQHVVEQDAAWVSKQKPIFKSYPKKLHNLYTRTLLTLKQMQDPMGGIIAAPEFQFEFTECGGYGYCWGRDAGFISYAMDVCGMHTESANFYRYIARCQSADGSFLHRHDMAGNLGSSWGFLQPDETGSVIFGLWQHVKLSKDNTLAVELKDMITRAANWLSRSRFKNTKLPVNGVDLWEEREGIHVYSVAAMYAGLVGAIELCRRIDVPIPQEWRTASDDYYALINSSDVFGKEKMTRTLTHTEQGTKSEHVVDVSQLGVQFPFHAVDKRCSVSFASHVECIAHTLWRSGGGIGRYENDPYRKGNPWILSTFWLALTASELGMTPLAQKCFAWGVTHASTQGLFPEQVDPMTGEAAWVMPLTWSHAMFALAVHLLPPSTIEGVTFE